MKTTYRNISNFILCLIISLLTSVSVTAQSTLDWLEDQPPVNTITRVENNKFTGITAYPRRSIGSSKQSLNAQQMSCFDIICQKPFSSTTVASAQSLNPLLSYLRIYSPQAWQGQTDGLDKSGNGYPFNTTGPATANNQVFAGHWAYKPYTTISSEIGTDASIILTVADGSRTTNGTYYYVIRPAGSWENAEHVRIVKSGGVLTIDQRGYKSVARTWPAGSIIAQHQLGNGTGNLNWCYNLSTKCPLDANGKKAHEAFSSWLVNFYDKDGNGDPSVALVDGIQYDADPLAFVDGGGIASRDADLDNDGVSDWGFDAQGYNHWGKGLELFYSAVRSGIDGRGKTNAVILGGVAESYGIIPNNGTQMEAAWSHQFGEDGAKAGAYNHIAFYVSGMKAQTGHGVIGPRVTDVQSKEASAIYYGTSVETRNAPYRFSYAMTMMFDGAWFSNQNGFGDAFHYFDEDAVYLEAGDNYGKSVLKTNTADIRLNNKWLGQAQGQYKRVYDETTYELSKNLIPNGNFESALSSWTGTNAAVSNVSDKIYEGAASLLISPTLPNNDLQLDGAIAIGPAISLTANQEYTLCFAVYSEEGEQIIRPRIGSFAQKLFITPGWSKHVVCWKESTGGSSAIKFDVGSDLKNIWIDQLYLFASSADVFRRDFENGIILANATNSPKTISLNGTFRRIQGNLDAVYNNGQTGITQVTLAAHDGIFLIKQTPTGISKNADVQFSAYPNPFSTNFIVDFPEGINRFEIFDISGVKILEIDLDNLKTMQVDHLAEKPSGFYFAKLSGSQNNQLFKIVKK